MKDENREHSHALVLVFVTNYISFMSSVTTPVCSVRFFILFGFDTQGLAMKPRVASNSVLLL